MDGNAIILTGGKLDHISAKTTHGLIRGTERFHISGVIDENHAGKDAGEVVDGVAKNIPVFESIDDFIKNSKEKADFCIIGVAFKGGLIPPEIRGELHKAIRNGISIINGLHEYLSDIPEFKSLADQFEVKLIDIRKPRPKKELRFWSGKIKEVTVPIVAVLGTDCSVGKRTTGRMLTKELNAKNIKTEMIYTGQTGWMCGLNYGFIFDATYNDFVSGEMEQEIVACFEEVKPDLILLEGQSSLMNPSGPCGSEFILSGEARGVILQHKPSRKKFKDYYHLKYEIPPIEKEIDLISFYGAETIAVALNSEGLTEEDVLREKDHLEAKLNIPVVIPFYEGVYRLVEALKVYSKKFYQTKKRLKIPG